MKRGFLLGLIVLAFLVTAGCNSEFGKSVPGFKQLQAVFSKQTDPKDLTPEAQVESFVLAMQKKKYAVAQAFLTKSYQSVFTPEKLAESPISPGSFALVGSELKEKGNKVRAMVYYKIVKKDKSEDSLAAELVREDGIWKVSYFGPDDF